MSGLISLTCGSSQTGKSSGVEAAVLRARRALIWDVEAQFCEFPGVRRISTPAELHRIATRHPGAGRFAYVPRGKLGAAFEGWAQAAMYWGRYLGPCLAVAEELSDVTTPGKAPPAWGVLVRRCAKRGIDLSAITQRPAESDKTIVGNAHIIRCYRMTREKDRAYMAEEMGLTPEQRARLDGLQNYEYIERDARTGRVKFGKNPKPKYIQSR